MKNTARNQNIDLKKNSLHQNSAKFEADRQPGPGLRF